MDTIVLMSSKWMLLYQAISWKTLSSKARKLQKLTAVVAKWGRWAGRKQQSEILVRICDTVPLTKEPDIPEAEQRTVVISPCV